MTSFDQIDSLLSRAARLAGDYLRENGEESTPVALPMPPHELEERLGLSLPERGRPLESLIDDARDILEYSVRTSHPRFFNQLFGGIDPAAVLGEWITALSNTSMYTYESAPVATLIELKLMERLLGAVGFAEGEGVFAPGGSISNLMSVLVARHRAYPHAKENGLGPDDRPTMFVSAEAHYSLQRAAAVSGIGIANAVPVATDEVGRMRMDALESAVQDALAAGRQPFLVAATSGTTVPGAFDPLVDIADVCRRHDMWMHVDASYGGTVLLSRTHRHLMRGVELADSVTWNPHKLMGVPLACSATLMKRKGDLVATNGMGADYLFHDGPEAAPDLGDLTLQCGRRVDALKLWMSWQALGDEGYEARIDRLFELAHWFRERIGERPGFRLIREPEGPNVCFRYVPPALAGSVENDVDAGALTVRVRERLMQRGRFMVNYATLDGAPAFRLVLANHGAGRDDLEALIEEIEAIGAEIAREALEGAPSP